ncbi:MAG: glutamate--tRNA ligase [Coriobacteriia bacterium]|nr:glutamate--tRNA ligase [Coriobacteriia bacterium]
MTETTNEVRVRFAPSPTGRLHIGGARTAIDNWAYARATGGKFILRIEDTDPERSTEENKQVILRAMKWLGLDWDEGPLVGGPFGPYTQMERMDTYTAALEELKASGNAYPCFCTKEEIDAKRAKAEAEEGGYAGYDGTCRGMDPAEAEARIAAGEPHVWRLAVPKDHGPIEFDDAVYGHMSFPADVMDDLILIRSDGTPTYNFAVVCDDSNMQITHVVRGDDHLSNTPRQILIYEALGRPVPTFAHLSMILGADGKKLSKRHGATSVEEYRDRGYLPEAVVNFLALLGWSLDGETTIIPPEVLCREFSLDRITKKDAIFDETKLDWMNGVYIREMDADRWYELSKPWLAQAVALGRCVPAGANVVPTPNPADPNAPVPEPIEVTEQALADAAEFVDANPELFKKIFPQVRERLNRLDDVVDKIAFMFWGENCRLDQKSYTKQLEKEASRAPEVLAAVRDLMADESLAWECDAVQDACKELCERMELKPRVFFGNVRVAICGSTVSPPLFELLELMDRATVVARIEGVLALLQK